MKSDGDDDADVEELGLDGGAQAQRRVKVEQPLQHRAARVLGAAPYSDVNQPAQHVHARVQL